MKKLFFLLLLLPLCLMGSALAKTAPSVSSVPLLFPSNQLSPEIIALVDRDIASGLKIFLEEKSQEVDFIPEDLASLMAYAYTVPSSKFYQQAAAIKSIRSLFFSLQKTLEEAKPDGIFPIVQKLEPLIYAYLAIKDALPENEQKAFSSLLLSGLHFIASRPLAEFNHRGMACVAVLSLGYKLSGDKAFLNYAKQLYASINSIFTSAGEVLEDGKPDFLLSAHSLQSLYLLRITSEDAELDKTIFRCMDWYTGLSTAQGYPLLSLQPSFTKKNKTNLAGLLSALSFCSAKEPKYAYLARKYYETVCHAEPGSILPRGGHFFLRGAGIPKTEIKDFAPGSITPAQVFVHPDMQYLLVKKHYQTAVNLRSLSPCKGLQAWAYGNEPPIIFPGTDNKTTRSIGLGFDSSVMDIQGEGNEYGYRLSHLSGQVDVLVVRQGELFTGYLFSPDAMVVIFNNRANQGFRTEFVGNPGICPSLDILSKESITFKNSLAKIVPCREEPKQSKSKSSTVLSFDITGGSSWFTFSGKNTKSLIRLVVDDLFFIYIEENNEIWNTVINLSSQEFNKKINYPDTAIPIPPVQPYGSCFAQTLQER